MHDTSDPDVGGQEIPDASCFSIDLAHTSGTVVRTLTAVPQVSAGVKPIGSIWDHNSMLGFPTQPDFATFGQIRNVLIARDDFESAVVVFQDAGRHSTRKDAADQCGGEF